MKKLMCGFVAAGLCAAVFADGVESANIVGYNKIKVTGGQMNLLCVNWDSVGGTSGQASLKEVMSTKGLISYDADFIVQGDYINTWNMEKGDWGTPYYYADQAEAWGDPMYADTWVDITSGDPIPDPVMLNPGSAFWLYHGGSDLEDFDFAGQVVTGENGYTLQGGQMNLCGNPYPTTLDLRSASGQVKITGATSYDEDFIVPGDYINTWNLTKGDWGTPYYYADQADAWGDPMYADTWVDITSGDPVPANTAIAPGAGFWYYATKPGVTFSFTEIK